MSRGCVGAWLGVQAWQLDWGVVAVYTCTRSCELNGAEEGDPYAEEFVWRQPGH